MPGKKKCDPPSVKKRGECVGPFTSSTPTDPTPIPDPGSSRPASSLRRRLDAAKAMDAVPPFFQIRPRSGLSRPGAKGAGPFISIPQRNLAQPGRPKRQHIFILGSGRRSPVSESDESLFVESPPARKSHLTMEEFWRRGGVESDIEFSRSPSARRESDLSSESREFVQGDGVEPVPTPSPHPDLAPELPPSDIPSRPSTAPRTPRDPEGSLSGGSVLSQVSSGSGRFVLNPSRPPSRPGTPPPLMRELSITEV